LKNNKQLIFPFLYFGLFLYLTRLLRDSITDLNVLFFLGFLPNFGAAIAIPFLAIRPNKLYTLRDANQRVTIGCICTIILLPSNEFIDLYQKNRTFDILDICASFFGATLLFTIYHLFLKHKLIFKE
jgi:hypothetical protein